MNNGLGRKFEYIHNKTDHDESLFSNTIYLKIKAHSVPSVMLASVGENVVTYFVI